LWKFRATLGLVTPKLHIHSRAGDAITGEPATPSQQSQLHIHSRAGDAITGEPPTPSQQRGCLQTKIHI
jgi:hypothetical protein